MSFSNRKVAPQHRPMEDRPGETAAPGLGEAGRASAPVDRVIRTSHADIAVRQSAGTKLPTLLLHGNSTGKAVFDRQFASALGQDYRLIALDLPGHGASSDAFDPSRSYSMTGYADAVIEVIEELGLDQVAVVGWSLGGHVAMEMMGFYPDLAGLMVIGAPPVDVTEDGIRQGFNPHPDLLLAGKRDFTDADTEAFARTVSGGADDPELRAMIRRTDGRARQCMFENLLAGRASNQRRSVETLTEIPVAMVNGAEEPFVNAAYVSGLPYANLWRGTCHFIPRTGHAPFREAPQVFNDLLTRFLADMSERARARTENPPTTYSA